MPTPFESEFKGKYAIVLTKDGHWFYGRIKYVSREGIIVTNFARLLPMFDKDGNEVMDEKVMMTERAALPFKMPVWFGDEKGYRRDHLISRKMFIPWGNLKAVWRAKTEEEIKAEEEAEHAKENTGMGQG